MARTSTLLVAGVDEAGRGPLAGPVFAAAVILNPAKPILGLKDSKILSEKKREVLYDLICESALAFAIGQAEVHEIDTINILQATLLAMQRAVNQLTIKPQEVWIDGNQQPFLSYKTRTIIKGDETIPVISAASILAKVSRDRVMHKLHEQYPGYHFNQNKGYATEAHLTAIENLGVTAIHRRSFAPVKNALEGVIYEAV